jgi:Gram-negative porin
MNKKLIALAVAASVAIPMAAQAEMKVKWFGFAQMTGQILDQKAASDKDTLTFGADRVRIGFKVKDGPVFAKLQVDFNKPSPSKGGCDISITIPGGGGTDTDSCRAAQDKTGVNEIIKDALVGYKVADAFKISFGQFKTPLGMDFNTSGKKLDITKRGMEKKLVLERTQGIMFSGKVGGGVGYDVFYGNPSARSSATSGYDVGIDNTTVVRIKYDMGKTLHVEAATGTSGVDGGEDYKVNDIAVKYKTGPVVVKAEYISATGVKNTADRDETVIFVHGGLMVAKSIELVGRYYTAERDDTDTDLSNLYLGANFFLGSNKTNGRLQVNYVVVGGDDIDASTPYNGVATTYMDNALLVQYQASF